MQEQKASNPALGHLRANVLLLVLSLVICSVLYPAAVWVVAQLFFHHKAEGSLVYQKDKDGKDVLVGSTQIAQQFNSAWFFQPRPSAASYNGAASSGSNYAASSPKLRGRVATLLGTIARYSDAYKKAHPKSDGSEQSVQDDILAWFKEQTAPTEKGKDKRDLFSEWATNNSTIAQAWATGGWVTGGAWTKDYILQWAKDHPDVVAAWKKDNASATGEPGADALVVYFFKSYEKEFFGKWPTAETLSAWAKDHPNIVTRWKAANPGKDDPKDDDLAAYFKDDSAANPDDWPAAKAGEWLDVDQKQVVKPDAADSDVEGTFFDMWLAEQVQAKKLDPLKDFEQVPADMVMTSGSGLDPDISLANARYQKESVVPAYADKLASDYVAREENKNLTDDQKKKLHDDLADKLKTDVGKVVDKLLDDHSDLVYRPMWGLTGDAPLVNVLQVNLRLQAEAAKIQVR
jgi:K+-transporting ATPase ATPase C chain